MAPAVFLHIPGGMAGSAPADGVLFPLVQPHYTFGKSFYHSNQQSGPWVQSRKPDLRFVAAPPDGVIQLQRLVLDENHVEYQLLGNALAGSLCLCENAIDC